MLAVTLFPERDCATCTAAQKAEWGCETDGWCPQVIDGEQHFRCPRRPILEDPEGFREVFRVYRAYQKGFLPELGGLEAQAAKLTRALDLIEVTTTQCEEQRQAEDARKRARSGRAPRPRM